MTVHIKKPFYTEQAELEV